ncbi:class I SAM-dependent methyltransferase [Maribacter sp. MMG018]|uniref:class I SAM-dependent methyltransferase n=1 Tax=Maribacter sp. MMG018 TaxID=2822688 RepID=UPI001B379FE9|nr:class I SAM-dependent methyltransferase [Maribacter sp. MMG018]MBQ4914766.1 class I SAM-dependent methyltransferase [Maribacter sp. MMG018]
MDKKDRTGKRNKKPWPTKDAMAQVYEMNLWGRGESDFYSGEGSHCTEIVHPYVAVLKTFLSTFRTPLVVCDLGCGDFNVGKQLTEYTSKYIAVDIVPDLIAHNKKKFKKENLEFYCLDIATDNLPMGDCAIVRQVLQHLSNAEVKRVVAKLANYKYVVLTEHVPEGNFEPNKDIISGQGTRLKKQSGIDLLVAPFNFKVKEKKELLSVVLDKGKGRIVTTLYKTV